ncbi:related to microfibril-associated protein [Serendipita indica DSM 11827]|uniref:Related to microfibril-associated protein n=1 Tax=Serendipita indica (strain DSM 11827) TaxID=1109443 RepID=G4TCW2_SERID|nr:related to microfibril-associated protein [Serendipita indica DSM 11827]
MSAVRKLAPRHAKPAQRHFAKKAPKDARDLDESSDEEEEQVQAEDAGDVQIGDYDAQEEETDLKTLVPATPARPRGAKTVKVALGNVEVKDGRVFVDGKAESGMTVVEQQKAQESSESESDEEEEESSEESSEEDEPPRPQLRPVFVSKQQRETLKERDAIAFDSEEAMKKREQAAEERKRQSVNMVGESIKRGMEEKEAKMPGQEIDDTDGLDPEAEFNLWRMRELMRLKREKEAERAREEERLEIERRRALPEEQRLKEDMERAKKLREAKPQGSGAFLQKYWHKGAFYQDLDELKNRDYTAPIESQVDISLLPKVMQVKDFGKRSRTKYTYLKDQDTTLAPPPKVGGATLPQPPGGQGCFLCGGPHLKKGKVSRAFPVDKQQVATRGLQPRSADGVNVHEINRLGKTEIVPLSVDEVQVHDVTITVETLELQNNIAQARRVNARDRHTDQAVAIRDHGHPIAVKVEVLRDGGFLHFIH